MANFGANLNLIEICLGPATKEELFRLEWINNQINQQKYNYSAWVVAKYAKNPKDNLYIVNFFADISDWKDPNEVSEKELELMEGLNR